MTIDYNLFKLLGGFLIVAIAANVIAQYFLKHKMPVITGLLITGIVSGPFVFNLIPSASIPHLSFINDVALAFIAFAASAELYLREMRSRLNSIKWMTASQLLITFIISTTAVYFFADLIPFIKTQPVVYKIAIASLFGVVFIARSPASAIAIVNEMRAKGPFVQTVLGVTVLIDFFVILFFSFALEVSVAIFEGSSLNLGFILILLLELGSSFLTGLLLGRLLIWLLKSSLAFAVKSFLVVLSGYLIYIIHHYISDLTYAEYQHSISIEPLLVCIVGSFIVTNYSAYRAEFLRILEKVGPYIYVAFFVLSGAAIELNIFIEVIGITFILFLFRLGSLMIGGFVGSKIAGDPPLFSRISWMPYVTQAGVGLGLATIVASTFPGWGTEFATIIISVIVLNQLVGPPLFKWAINIVGEGHTRADTPEFDGIRDAIIFGLEPQSVALARQLIENGWMVKIATLKKDTDVAEYPDLDVRKIDNLSLETIKNLDAELSEAIVTMLTDDENYTICEQVYEHIGTKDVIVRLNHRFNFTKFHQLGTLIVDPSTAIVSLLDHFVRSPQAATLLLGMQENQDSRDVEVLNTDLHSLRLRNLRLPSDVIVLSLKRRGNFIITHGYTRLRRGDILTLVGSKDSLNQVALKFEGA
ncbi:MAG: potassium transporter TrkA [Bacteroidetes bacterium]|nr:MAG: potassium transporter TrkA [Bacteroidota bacterium]